MIKKSKPALSGVHLSDNLNGLRVPRTDRSKTPSWHVLSLCRRHQSRGFVFGAEVCFFATFCSKDFFKPRMGLVDQLERFLRHLTLPS